MKRVKRPGLQSSVVEHWKADSEVTVLHKRRLRCSDGATWQAPRAASPFSVHTWPPAAEQEAAW
jgi:hypothetical protein